MNLNWVKCGGQQWCNFLTVNLNDPHFAVLEGVYIIWQGNGPVIRVGQGLIRERLASHRNDTQIRQYPNLYAAWADVPRVSRDGVERYLANVLSPRVGLVFPATVPISVNLPWPWSK